MPDPIATAAKQTLSTAEAETKAMARNWAHRNPYLVASISAGIGFACGFVFAYLL
jgi:ElaB/YqjD/DUF883 family membrane-anchored ribosome-binding protein